LEEKKNIEFCVGCELMTGTKNDKINVCVCVCLWQKMLANLEVNETWNWVNFLGVLCEQRSIYNSPNGGKIGLLRQLKWREK
jgi:hypothetical protein